MNNYVNTVMSIGKTFINSFLSLKSDVRPGKSLEKEIVRRDIKYTELLENYIEITKKRNSIKEFHKWFFFWFVIFLCGVVVYITYTAISKILSTEDYNMMMKTIPIFITSLVSCVTAVIAIPLTITNFLFNTKEDDNIANIIQHMQDHDMKSITLLKENFVSEKENSSIAFSESDNK